ncbi:MAG: histidine phosphatase family protein [Elusimicrobiota bacterium]
MPRARKNTEDTKTLILLRHAHRDVADRRRDNGLSRRGRRQARRILRFYKARFGRAGALILSSPKKRCRQTVEPLARLAGSAVKNDPRLLERRALESARTFRARAAGFMRWWIAEAPALTVACSHGDWIPAAARAAGAPVELKKGGWLELTEEAGQVRLVWVLQVLPREIK